MEAALNLILLKASLIKNSVVRQEIDGGAGLFGLSHYGKQPVF